MWSAIRYRRGQALVLLALAAVSTACAVLTPLYDRAMQQALTRQTVDGATSGDTTVEIRSVSRYAYGDDPDHRPAPHDELATLLPAPVRPWFTPRVDATSVQVVRVDRGAAPAVGPLLWRDGACEHLVWVAGGCPRERGDIAVSPADADNFGLAVGSVLRAGELPTMALPTLPPPVTLRVTGIYRQVRGPYWAGQELTGVSGILGRQPPIRPLHDTWLATEPTFSGDGWLDLGNSVTFPLDRSAVGIDEVTRTGTAVTAAAEESRLLAADFGYRSGAGGVLAEVRSGLPDIAATIERGRRQALIIVPLLTIQLGLLALFVLGLALGAAVEQRRPEVAVARLRGAGRAGGRRLALAELVPVVLAGVPVGVVVALGLSAVARRTVLGGAAPFELPGAFWLAVAGAAVLVAAVAWATVAAGTRDRISALLRGVPARAPRWGLGAVDALVVAGAGTTVALFATGDLYGPVALAAPALLALGAGLPRYFFDDPGAASVTGPFAAVRLPIAAAAATDDDWAPPRSRDAFFTGYPAAPLDRIDVTPAELGVRRIGHMGYFHADVGRVLWPRMLSWLAGHGLRVRAA